MKNVMIDNVGPVARLEIPVPEEGGVVVLRGRNGTGKTYALRATEALLAGRGDLESRDGSLGGGIAGLGVRLTVGRRTKAAGELEVEALEGEDPSLLVDPGLQDPDAADARRVAALCRLARVAASPALFAELLGGEEALREIARPSTLEQKDVPAMAAGLKRDVEARARAVEAEAENVGGRAAGLFAAVKDLDFGEASDATELAAATERSVRELAELEATVKAGLEVKRKAEEAAAQLARAEATSVSTDASRNHTAEEWRSLLAMARANVVDITNAMQDLRLKLGLAEALVRDHVSCLAAAENRERMIAGWRAAIEALGSATPVGEADLAAKRAAVDQARRAQELGAVLRRAHAQKDEAQALMERAAELDRGAKRLRDAARGMEQVVSAAIARVAPRGLFVRDGRLAMTTARGETLFADLSDGERWRIALDVAIDAIGEAGLLVIGQAAWEGLDPINRAAVAAHARSRRTVILTAEADERDLRAEVLA